MLFPAPAIFDLRWCRSYSHRCKQKWPKGHCWRNEATKHDCVVLQPLETYIKSKRIYKGYSIPWMAVPGSPSSNYPTILRTKCLLDNPKGASDRSDPKYEISFSFPWSEHFSYLFIPTSSGLGMFLHLSGRVYKWYAPPWKVWDFSIKAFRGMIDSHLHMNNIKQQNSGTAIFYQKE